MDYYKIFNFSREPFSNSPDPDFFFHSRQHIGYLQKLELAIRLRRGLNVIIGDVGTGKTTLCRQLIRKFAETDDVQTHLLLDPFFNSSLEFLSTLTEMFGISGPEVGATEWQFRELIKKYLFRHGVDEGKTVVLIIDEGQKIPDFCLEILREFLNYEINEHKLLQIVIFAQKEFEQTIEERANFSDRINVHLFLGPLDFVETRNMIRYRLKRATEHGNPSSMFSYPALWAVYRATGGYPRKIINLCHQIVLTLIIQNRSRAGWPLVRSCVSRISTGQTRRMYHKTVVVALIGLAAILILTLFPDRLKTWLPWYDVSKTISTTVVSSKNFAIQDKDKDKDKVGIKPSFPVENAIGRIDGNVQPTKPENKSPNHRITEYEAEYENQLIGQQNNQQNNKYEAKPENKSPNHRITEYKANIVNKDFVELSETNNFSVLLGKIRAKRGETVLDMIYRVYGLPARHHLHQIILIVKQLNPQIDNLNTIYVGEAINFPAIPAVASVVPDGVWWVEVKRCKTLEETYNFVKLYTYSSFSLRIFPYQNKREGMNFAVLLKNCFVDEQFARKAISRLPKVVAANAKIVNKWEKDTVFFSNLPKVNQSTNLKDIS